MYKQDSSLYLKNKHFRFGLPLGVFMAMLTTPVFAWQTLGTGMNGSVKALALDSNGNLYAGGQFTTADGTSANHIAKWDGNRWSPLANGANGDVYALHVDSNDNLFVGGNFSMIGNNPTNNIAKWSNGVWSTLGIGLNDSVYALTSDTYNLYVGGAFDHVVGEQPNTTNHIASWNGSVWSALNNGVNDDVYTLVAPGNGAVYVGGAFTVVDNNPAISHSYNSMWNGSSWSSIGYGLSGAVYTLMQDSANNLYAGGNFTNLLSPQNTGNKLAIMDFNYGFFPHWVSLGATGEVLTLTTDSRRNIYASGPSCFGAVWMVTYWSCPAAGIGRLDSNTGTWSALSSNSFSAHTLVVDSNDNVYAGGDFTVAGEASANSIAVYVSQTIPANQWRLISLPHAPLAGAVLQDNSMFGDNLNSTYDINWVVYERNEVTKTYRKLAATDRLVQGKGYWIYSLTDTTLDMDGTATPLVTTNPNCTSSKGCYEVALTSTVNGETKRNNLVGFPFFRPTSWANVRFEVNGFAYSPSAAETNNFAAKTLWKYNGSSHETYDDVTPGLTGTLSKMEGFWVRLLPGSTGKTVKLLIPLS